MGWVSEVVGLILFFGMLTCVAVWHETAWEASQLNLSLTYSAGAILVGIIMGLTGIYQDERGWGRFYNDRNIRTNFDSGALKLAWGGLAIVYGIVFLIHIPYGREAFRREGLLSEGFQLGEGLPALPWPSIDKDGHDTIFLALSIEDSIISYTLGEKTFANPSELESHLPKIKTVLGSRPLYVEIATDVPLQEITKLRVMLKQDGFRWVLRKGAGNTTVDFMRPTSLSP